MPCEALRQRQGSPHLLHIPRPDPQDTSNFFKHSSNIYQLLIDHTPSLLRYLSLRLPYESTRSFLTRSLVISLTCSLLQVAA